LPGDKKGGRPSEGGSKGAKTAVTERDSIGNQPRGAKGLGDKERSQKAEQRGGTYQEKKRWKVCSVRIAVRRRERNTTTEGGKESRKMEESGRLLGSLKVLGGKLKSDVMGVKKGLALTREDLRGEDVPPDRCDDGKHRKRTKKKKKIKGVEMYVPLEKAAQSWTSKIPRSEERCFAVLIILFTGGRDQGEIPEGSQPSAGSGHFTKGEEFEKWGRGDEKACEKGP